MMSTNSRRSCVSRSRRRLTFALGPVVALLAASGVAADDDGPEPLATLPLESTGQLQFFTDFSSFRTDDGEVECEFFVSVTNDQLEFRAADDSEWMSGRIRMRVVLRDESGRVAFENEGSLEPQASSGLDASDRAILQALRETATLEPGRYHLEVELTDEFGMRRGLFNRMRKAHNEGHADGWIEVRAFPAGEFSTSDLTLIRAWEVRGAGSQFGRNGVDLDPNPQGLYGLVLPRVRYYLEVYPGDFEEGDTCVMQAQVVDGSGIPRVERTTRVTPRPVRFAVTDELSLEKGVTAGSYELHVTVLNERTRRSVRVSRPFEVIWSVSSWGQDPAERLQEMALIMSEKEYRKLRELTPGAQEVYLAEFWHGVDPDPDTPGNNILEQFQARIYMADKEFESTLNRGIQTDRGRVYVRYGPPDDVVYEYSSSSYGGQATSERVADPSERATIGSRPSTSFLDPDEFREGDVSGLAEQRGGATVKSKQLEIWVYDGPGYPLTEHSDRGPSSHRGLKFIFADEMGNGNYTLIGSSGATIW